MTPREGVVNGTGTMTFEPDGAEETPRRQQGKRPPGVVGVQVPAEIRDLIEQRARESDRNLSYVIRRALYAGLGVTDPGDQGDRS